MLINFEAQRCVKQRTDNLEKTDGLPLATTIRRTRRIKCAVVTESFCTARGIQDLKMRDPDLARGHRYSQPSSASILALRRSLLSSSAMQDHPSTVSANSSSIFSSIAICFLLFLGGGGLGGGGGGVRRFGCNGAILESIVREDFRKGEYGRDAFGKGLTEKPRGWQVEAGVAWGGRSRFGGPGSSGGRFSWDVCISKEI